MKVKDKDLIQNKKKQSKSIIYNFRYNNNLVIMFNF